MSTIVVVPIFLLTVMLVVQYGLAYHAQRVLAAAAHDGAAAGARLDAGPGVGRTVAQDLIAQSASPLVDHVSVSAGANGDRIVVTARAQVVSLVPFAPKWTISATGSAPREEFRPEGDGG